MKYYLNKYYLNNVYVGTFIFILCYELLIIIHQRFKEHAYY